MTSLLFILLTLFCGCGGGSDPVDEPKPEETTLTVEPTHLTLQGASSSRSFKVTAGKQWTLSSSEAWCTTTHTSGFAGETNVHVTATANTSDKARTAELTIVCGSLTKKVSVTQEGGTVVSYVPEGYKLVWQDDFESGKMPDLSKWYYETGANGWGNHELQNYVAGAKGTDTCAIIKDGVLSIIAKKVGSEVLSVRMNTRESWTYGYFEARLQLPKGKGTWPAFWMLPKDAKSWPLDGEIDIMEEVGYDPNVVLSTIHCKAYNHSIGTQKGGQITVPTAQAEFHVYALKWTEDAIYGYVDGKEYFRFDNDKKGNKETWPFNVPFYVKLNLAWGGDWGGAKGVDESALPATYMVDYVRVYQPQ